jgi:hypothetical protein
MLIKIQYPGAMPAPGYSLYRNLAESNQIRIQPGYPDRYSENGVR